jgi:hypothetical protein
MWCGMKIHIFHQVDENPAPESMGWTAGGALSTSLESIIEFERCPCRPGSRWQSMPGPPTPVSPTEPFSVR